MSGAAVWTTNFEHASLTAVFEDDLKAKTISKDEFAAFQAIIIKGVPEGEKREDALKRIETSNPDIFWQRGKRERDSGEWTRGRNRL
jgi:hypothetical protein